MLLKEKGWCNRVFTNDRKLRIYRRKITVQIVTVGPTSLIISTFSALECMTFITLPLGDRCHSPLSLNVFVASLKTFPGKPNGKNHSKVKRVQLRKLPLE